MVRELIALEPSARVWIFASERAFSYDELDDIREKLHTFLEEWTSHSKALLTYGNVFHRRFLAIFVDESMAAASGCSIDTCSRFVQSLSNELGVDFFQRNWVYSLQNDEIKPWKLTDLKQHYQNGEFGEDTLFFDHLVPNKEAFLKKWLVPLKNSWINRFVK